MQYRHFNKQNHQPSALGFGAMRLPKLANGQIDEALASAMIREAVDAGVNYIDTAYGYHNGQSELFIGKTLKDGYRNKVMLASKLPVWLVNQPEDYERLLDEQLNRLKTDHLDYYLFHSLNSHYWHNVVLRHDLLPRAEKALRDGKIRHIGFSFHDQFDVFKTILDGYSRWEVCQIQYNYLDINEQAGTRGLHEAAARGLGVIIMEPLRGGRLSAPPAEIASIFAAADPNRTPADWALQWLWNQPEVSLVLSGMSSMEQVRENLASASVSRIGLFCQQDLNVFEKVREAFNRRGVIPCTACGYCMPCPNGVDIPKNFRYYNEIMTFDTKVISRGEYQFGVPEGARASHCIQCRICEEKCPQGIKISEWMPKVQALLG